MSGLTIFRRTLRDSRKAMLGIGLGGAIMAIWVTALFPTFKGFDEFNQLLESPIIKALVGDVGDYTTPEGFLGSEFFGFMPLFLAFYTVVVGLGIIGSEEVAGRLDVLLSTPVPRWRIILEKFLAYVVVYLAILAVMFLGFVLILALMPEVEIAIGRVGEGVLNLLPALLVMTALPLLLTTLVRGRGTAGAIAGAIIVASWFITALADLAPDVLGTIQYLSMFTYYNSFAVLSRGMQWGDFALLTAATAAMVGLTLFFFQRRDLIYTQ